jgi:hypothetical protein
MSGSVHLKNRGPDVGKLLEAGKVDMNRTNLSRLLALPAERELSQSFPVMLVEELVHLELVGLTNRKENSVLEI